jgi:hypothetical protein
MNDEIITRLFEITERFECLQRAVKEQANAEDIMLRAKGIQRIRGLLKVSEGS